MKETNLTLHHYWRSSCSWRVRWALELKGISYKTKAVNLLEGDHKKEPYLSLNPRGQVPTLQFGDELFTESLSIIEWLDERYPEKKVIFGTPETKRQMREVSYQIASGIQPIQNLSVMRLYSQEKERQKEWSSLWIEKGFEAIEKNLRKTATTFCFGNQVSLADLCLIPQVYNAKRFEVNMNPFPLIERVYENSLSLDSCKASHPDSFTP